MKPPCQKRCNSSLKKISAPCIALFLWATLLAPVALGQNKTLKAGIGGCEQQYNFFMKAQFNDLFWIGESLGGNCMTSQLIQILVGPDNTTKVINLELTDFNRWYWVESADGYLRDEIVVELKPQADCLVSNSSKLKVKPPAYNSTLFKLYREELQSACGEAFNNATQGMGIDLPKIPNREVELVYHHPKGIYFNYRLSKAYYFPDSQFMVLFTEQDIRCMGNNTAHGFMILKLTRK